MCRVYKEVKRIKLKENCAHYLPPLVPGISTVTSVGTRGIVQRLDVQEGCEVGLEETVEVGDYQNVDLNPLHNQTIKPVLRQSDVYDRVVSAHFSVSYLFRFYLP